MNSENLSEDEKWALFNAAMKKEREYAAIQEARQKLRAKTENLVLWVGAMWLMWVFVGLSYWVSK